MTTRTRDRRSGLASFGAILLVTLAGVGCYAQDMSNQQRYKPLAESDLFPNKMASRPLVAGTVARGQLNEDAHLHQGRINGEFATTLPMEVTRDLLQRGQERYDIYCSPCHDRSGSGNGIVVQRGYQRAASFHVDRLRQTPAGYYFDVISNGFGAMPAYRAQITVKDRWAIAAYVRVLQFSQHADAALLSPEDLERLGTRPVEGGVQ